MYLCSGGRLASLKASTTRSAQAAAVILLISPYLSPRAIFGTTCSWSAGYPAVLEIPALKPAFSEATIDASLLASSLVSLWVIYEEIEKNRNLSRKDKFREWLASRLRTGNA